LFVVYTYQRDRERVTKAAAWRLRSVLLEHDAGDSDALAAAGAIRPCRPGHARPDRHQERHQLHVQQPGPLSVAPMGSNDLAPRDAHGVAVSAGSAGLAVSAGSADSAGTGRRDGSVGEASSGGSGGGGIGEMGFFLWSHEAEAAPEGTVDDAAPDVPTFLMAGCAASLPVDSVGLPAHARAHDEESRATGYVSVPDSYCMVPASDGRHSESASFQSPGSYPFSLSLGHTSGQGVESWAVQREGEIEASREARIRRELQEQLTKQSFVDALATVNSPETPGRHGETAGPRMAVQGSSSD